MNIKMERREGMGEKKLKKRGKKWKRKCFFFFFSGGREKFWLVGNVMDKNKNKIMLKF